jgi:hypothetical protein
LCSRRKLCRRIAAMQQSLAPANSTRYPQPAGCYYWPWNQCHLGDLVAKILHGGQQRSNYSMALDYYGSVS